MLKKCHFIGIGGIGMSGLARILASKNCAVQGSDVNSNYITEALTQSGVQVFIGHDARYVNGETTVVYSSDIKQDNPEFLAALSLSCQLLHRSDLLAELLKQQKALTVTGTHGKTTTSSLLSWILSSAGKDPSFAIGGVVPGLKTNAQAGKGEFFVAEADESDGTFLKYQSYGSIITNIDLDHMNHFKTEEALINAFQVFIKNISHPDLTFICGDDARLRSLGCKAVSYGFSEHVDVRALNYRQIGWVSFFDIAFEGKMYKDVELNLVGKHNVLNALGCFGLSLRLGLSEEEIRNAFKSFTGVLRRAEKKFERNGVLFLDDYAHHPTEIKTTLKAVREAVQERRLVAVYQPHRYSRMKDCIGTFDGVFDDVDEVIITDIYAAGETPLEGVTHVPIVNQVKESLKIPVSYIPRQEIKNYLENTIRVHDVVISLGAGDITKLSGELPPNFLPPKLKLGLICGGRSKEHEISLRSAHYILSQIDTGLYDISLFGISKKGNWQILDASLQIDQEIQETFDSSAFQALKACDVLFPVLHGPYGEDGTIQGFFEMLNKPYVGCDVTASAISMDKAFTKRLIETKGILTSPFVDFTEYEWKQDRINILEKIDNIQFPVFVKPVHLGSTLGVKKVVQKEDLIKCIEFAFKYDKKLVVEQGIVGREIEFAVFGNEYIHVFPPGEICTKGQTYDYDSKYGENSMQTFTSADLSQELIANGMQLAKSVYQTINCSGLARIDFFLDTNNIFWLNEINPIPGFTVNSLYPKMCAKAGFEGKSLLHELIISALHRKRQMNVLEVVV